jgi:hypothetical protein
MTYEHTMLLLALGFLIGVSIRPLRSALRRFHRAARKGRRVEGHTRIIRRTTAPKGRRPRRTNRPTRTNGT